MSAAPQEFKGTLYRIYSLPKVFEIKFYHKDGENALLTKIGKCALTNIGIKYGGDRFQTFATDHGPVQTDISLQFIELVLQTQNTMGGHTLSNNAASAVVDEFGGMAAAESRTNVLNAANAQAHARATATAVDDFSGIPVSGRTHDAGEFSSGSAMGAVKSKASGGASFIPDGGAG